MTSRHRRRQHVDPLLPGLPAAVAASWDELRQVLAQARTPCQGADGGAWLSDDRRARTAAAAACAHCPALGPCGAYADAGRETGGVWGGRDRTPRPRKAPRPAGPARP